MKKYEKVDSYNTTAGGQFKNAIEQFYLKVRESVDFSKTQLYQNYPESSLKVHLSHEVYALQREAQEDEGCAQSDLRGTRTYT